MYNIGAGQPELRCPFEEGDLVTVKEPFTAYSEGIWEVDMIMKYSNEVKLTRPIRGGNAAFIWKKYHEIELAKLAQAKEAPDNVY